MPSKLETLRSQLPPLNSSPTIFIKQSELSKRDIADNYLDNGIDDDALFDLGFSRRFNYPEFGVATKFGLPRVDIAHSSIYLQPINQYQQAIDRPFTIGRLPPFFQKIGRVNKNIIATEMANESHYWFLSWRPFEVVFPIKESRIIVYGHEIKSAIILINKYVCERQIGDMVHSNCYSASMSILSELVCIIAASNRTPEQKEMSMHGLFGLIHRYSVNHYGIGVVNNSIVLAFIQKAIDTAHQYGYGYLLHSATTDVLRRRV